MKKKQIAGLALALILLAGGTALAVRARKDVRAESRASIRQAVIRAAAECYGVEGAYPESLDYLEENYGLSVNHRDFLVIYEAFASNRLPQVQVLVRGEG